MTVKREENGRDSRGRFIQGNKGGGRAPIAQDVRQMLKAATPKAAKLLIDTIDNEDAKMELRMDAAKTILDRVYGKPTQPIDGTLAAQLNTGKLDGVLEQLRGCERGATDVQSTSGAANNTGRLRPVTAHSGLAAGEMEANADKLHGGGGSG